MDKIVIKQEPVDIEGEISCEPVAAISYEAIAAPVTVKKTKARKKSKSKSSRKNKKEEAPVIVVKEENSKKMPKVKVEKEKDVYVEPPRAGVFPDRSMSDFYCGVCDAHMNSIQVWESHIKGKRHLKNVKKGNAKKEKVEKENVGKEHVENDASGANAPVAVKKESGIVDVVEGLFFIDTVGAQSPPPPPTDCSAYEIPASPADTNEGQGCTPEHVPLSPSPPSIESVSSSSSIEMSTVDMAVAAIMDLPPLERLDYLKEMSESCVPETEEDMKQMKAIIAKLARSVFQYNKTRRSSGAVRGGLAE